MPISKAQQKATRKYNENNYDRLDLRVPKGDRDKYKEIAESNGMSLRRFVISALEEKVERMTNGNQE